MFKFRDYQQSIIDHALPILKNSGFAYLSMEVRTGKTHTALGLGELLKVNRVLFLTTKKTWKSGTIEADHTTQGCKSELTIMNYESIHKLEDRAFDLLILDEAHLLGAFPKPSKRGRIAANLKQQIPYTILLSGTPTPESFSQYYHQLWGLPNTPFAEFTTFYKFAHRHVNITQQRVGSGHLVNNYSDGRESIFEAVQPFQLSCTQSDAGFETPVNEHRHLVPIDPRIHGAIEQLKRDKVIISPNGKEILADTGAKELMKVHQMCSGTVKFEDGSSRVLCKAKAEYIRENWKGQKIAVFYKFVAEKQALMQTFGDTMTDDLTEFYETDKSLCIQIVSGRSGISLRQASTLVFYNIDFSATSYWQARDRLTTKDRDINDIHWIFSDYGLEEDIYDTVQDKADYTLAHYRRS